MNERIRVREVRVIDEEGKQIGVMPTRDALTLAREKGFDLVEVSPTALPPVTRIMDYGKFRYDQSKKERESRKTQKTIEIKELRIEPKIGENDVEIKTRQAQGFLEKGHKVRVTVLFRGRSIAHPELGRDLLTKMADSLKTYGQIESPIRMEGKNMSMTLAKAGGGGGGTNNAAPRPAQTDLRDVIRGLAPDPRAQQQQPPAPQPPRPAPDQQPSQEQPPQES